MRGPGGECVGEKEWVLHREASFRRWWGGKWLPASLGGPQPLGTPLPSFPTFPPQVCGAFGGGGKLKFAEKGKKRNEGTVCRGQGGAGVSHALSLLSATPIFFFFNIYLFNLFFGCVGS